MDLIRRPVLNPPAFGSDDRARVLVERAYAAAHTQHADKAVRFARDAIELLRINGRETQALDILDRASHLALQTKPAVSLPGTECQLLGGVGQR